MTETTTDPQPTGRRLPGLIREGAAITLPTRAGWGRGPTACALSAAAIALRERRHGVVCDSCESGSHRTCDGTAIEPDGHWYECTCGNEEHMRPLVAAREPVWQKAPQ